MSDGNKVSFDEEKFRAAFAADPAGVATLFTEFQQTTATDGTQSTAFEGVGHKIQTSLDSMTRSFDGLIARVTSGLDGQSDLLNSRVTQLNALLADKRSRLETQFANMETALAALQGQQSALTSLSQMASSLSA